MQLLLIVAVNDALANAFDDHDVIIIAVFGAVAAAGFKRPLIYAATEANADAFGKIALDNGLPLAVKANSIDGLIALTEKLTGMGVKDLVLDSGSRDVKQALEDQVAIRRAALKDNNKALGFPTITFPCEMASTLDMEALIAGMFVAKYGGIVVLSNLTTEVMFPLLLERLNIFTDPQRPMTVTEGIFEIGTPDENSPVLVTTNFALTYFIVSGEIVHFIKKGVKACRSERVYRKFGSV